MGTTPSNLDAGFVRLVSQTPARRTKAVIEAIERQIIEFAEAERPVSVRQVFYHLVTRPNPLIRKVETEYKSTVCRLMTRMRREGRLPFNWVSDATRWMRRPKQYAGLGAALDEVQSFYRRDLWADQDCYVEIWLEKESLAGVVYQVTNRWGVPLMVTKGYPSVTYLYSAAETIAAENKPAFIYYFGDHDPSGKDIPRFVEQELRNYAPDADITFDRMAITEAQIERFNLPTRPTKRTDSRAKNWKGDSVELDALAPKDLRRLVDRCILLHVDTDAFATTRAVEKAERRTLSTWIAGLTGADEDDDIDDDDDPFGMFGDGGDE